MGEFDRMYGAGVDASELISSSRDDYYDYMYSHLEDDYGIDKKIYFSSYEEASEWSKKNNGKIFKRSPDGIGFVEG